MATQRTLLGVSPNKNSEDRICAVGQSMAWPIWLAEQIDAVQENNSGVSVAYIPFSSSTYSAYRIPFFESEEVDLSTAPTHERNPRKVSNSQVSSYSNQLEGLIGATIEEIVSDYQNLNRKTVFCDHMISGASFSSFASLIFNLAEEKGLLEDVKEAIEWRIYSDFRNTPFQDKNGFALHTVRISFDDHELFLNPILNRNSLNLGSGVDEGAFCDRLVPIYGPDQWHQGPIPLKNEEMQNFIKMRILGFKDGWGSLRYLS